MALAVSTPARTSWSGHAFGLTVDSPIPVLGCDGGPQRRNWPTLTLECVPWRERDDSFSGDQSTVLCHRGDIGDVWEVEIRSHPVEGYLLASRAFGRYRVSSGGDHIECEPRPGAPRPWQWYLIGQALPFACNLHDRETFHASAVELGGGAIAISGVSTGGKSSIAAAAVIAGATFLTDDVLAVTAGADGVIGYPGPAFLKLRLPTVDQLGSAAVGAVGRRLGADDESVQLGVQRADGAHPLRALYFLETGRDVEGVRLIPVTPPDPRLLLGATFNALLNDPARLARQLDVCAAIAEAVPMVRVELPARPSYADVAATILDDASHFGPA